MRVLAAMSGGVDSSVAAARMVDQGHEVVGVHLALSRKRPEAAGRSRGCCTLDDARDARRVADMLGIDFYVWDLSERFAEDVIGDFVEEYRQGRTPNPCLRCNERIKFSAVLDRAVAMDFDVVATGHYARLVTRDGCVELHRAVDATKDQSYVLGVLTADQIARSAFPLGSDLKGDVRTEAAARGLLVASKPDSHDICFIPDGDTAGWLRSRLGSSPGDIVDVESGDVLGQHDGAFGYTIGQRKGLGITTPAADGGARYVVGVDPRSRTVMVGPPTLLEVDVITGIKARWANEPIDLGSDCGVQIRAHGEEVPATITAVEPEGSVTVTLAEPLRGVAAGQALVIYDGTRVVGSVTISATRRTRQPVA